MDKYYDFVLSKDNKTYSDVISDKVVSDCLISYIDLTNSECLDGENIVSSSDYLYGKAICSGVTLNDIGRIGIDNGLILFDHSKIDFEEFLNIFTDSTYNISGNDFRLHLHPVKGNSNVYDYSIEWNDEGYYSLKGGFFQGFYKLHKFDYEVLPTHIENEWNIEMTVRPHKYETKDNILNLKDHTDTSGFIFYMGTRAENKFLQTYNTDVDSGKYETRYNVGDGYELSGKTINFNEITSGLTFSDGSNLYDLFKKEILIKNKFLTYDRTKYGLRAPDDGGDTDVIYEIKEHKYKDNPYLLFNNSKSGYTVDTIDEYFDKQNASEKYNFIKDIENNAFGIRITEDGKIGYRYLIKDCNSETGYSFIEEYSYSHIITNDEWNTINIKFTIFNGSLDKCGNPVGKRKMKIYIYVNGYLKLISKELDEFNFRELNETHLKQEGVPYNISIGGGTQGLCDSILLNYYITFSHILPIEKNFAGSFIGDIRSFKFYSCPMEYNKIKSNYLYENNI